MRIDTDTSALLDGLHLMVRAGHSATSARAINEALRQYRDGASASEAVYHGRAYLSEAHNVLINDIAHDDGMEWLAEQWAAQDRAREDQR